MKQATRLALALALAFSAVNVLAALGTSVEACASSCYSAESPTAASLTIGAGPIENPGVSYQRSAAYVTPGHIALNARVAGSVFFPFPASGRASFSDELLVTGVNPQDVQLRVKLIVAGLCDATPDSTQGQPNAGCGINVSLFNNSGQSFGMQSTGETSFVSNAIFWLSGFGVFAENDLFARLGAANSDLSISLTFESLTAGAVLTSRSGHHYASPVPEPRSLAFFLCGALALRSLAAGRHCRKATGKMA